MVKEVWIDDVFDKSVRYGRREGDEEEMMELLQVVIVCMARAIDEQLEI